MGYSSMRDMCIDNQWVRSKRLRSNPEILLGLAVLTFLILLFSRQVYIGSKVPKHPTLRVSHQRRRSDQVTHAQVTLTLSMLYTSLEQQGQIYSNLLQVLVSYSYYEKDEGQKGNLEYFLLEGLGINGIGTKLPAATDFSIVVNGDMCSPCAALSSSVTALNVSLEGVHEAWGGQRITVLHRVENFGMDIAAHNVRSSWKSILIVALAHL